MIGKIDLTDREIHLDATADAAVVNEQLLVELLQGIAPDNKKSQVRYNSFRILEIISSKSPRSPASTLELPGRFTKKPI